MDHLDQLLIDAWHRIGEKLRANRLLALKRSQRRRGILSHTIRPWCLALRAGDSRITEANVYLDPKHALATHHPHTITIDGKLIRRLTQPVDIPWPGRGPRRLRWHYRKSPL